MVFHSNLVYQYLFADDKQLYSVFLIADIDATCTHLVSCILDVRDWCASQRLQLNAGKTELMWFRSAANLRKISTTNLTLSVGDDALTPFDVVHELGVYLDAELTIKQHVNHVMNSCFFQLRRLRQIQRATGSEVTKRLVSAFVISKLDYCNAALSDLP